MSDRWNREVLASLLEKVAEQTKMIESESDYEALMLIHMRRDAEDNADWFSEVEK